MAQFYSREQSNSRASSILDSDLSSDEEGCSTFSTVLTRQNGLKVEGLFRATSVRMPVVRAITKTSDGRLQVVSHISRRQEANTAASPPVPALPTPAPTTGPTKQAQSVASTSRDDPSSLSSAVSSSFSTPSSQQTQFTIPTPPAAAHIVSPLSPEQKQAKGFHYGERGARSSAALPYDLQHQTAAPQMPDAVPGGRMGLASPTPSERSIAKDSLASGMTSSSRSASQRDYARQGRAGIEERIGSPMMESYEENVLIERPEPVYTQQSPVVEKVPTSPPNLLSTLWEVAEGAGNYQYPGIFVLNIYQKRPRDMTNIAAYEIPEHFIFGTDRTNDFYTLSAHPQHPYSKTNDELILTRRNPHTTIEQTVLTMTLPAKLPPVDQVEPIDPNNPDIVITYLYPTAIIDQALRAATSTAISEKSTAEDAQLATSHALQTVLQREGCRLAWDSTRRRYYLFHPGLGPSGNVFLIEIEGRVGFGLRNTKGNVKLLDIDQGETIACIDFATGQLFVDCRACLKAGNKHFLDVAVATLMAVCTVEGRRYRPFEQHPTGFPMPRSGPVASSQRKSMHPSRAPSTTVTRRQTMRTISKPQKEPKWSDPFVAMGKGAVKAVKGLAFAIIFVVGLGFEILKAIFDAFRPMPKEEGRERRAEEGRGDGGKGPGGQGGRI